MLTPILLQLQTVSNDLGNAAVQKGEISLSVLDLAMKGGWIMIVLAVFSIITVYIFVERYLTISKASVSDKNFMNNIREFIHAGRLDAAVTLCRSTDSPNARMIEKGLSRIGKPLNDINAAIENTGKLGVSS